MIASVKRKLLVKPKCIQQNIQPPSESLTHVPWSLSYGAVGSHDPSSGQEAVKSGSCAFLEASYLDLRRQQNQQWAEDRLVEGVAYASNRATFYQAEESFKKGLEVVPDHSELRKAYRKLLAKRGQIDGTADVFLRTGHGSDQSAINGNFGIAKVPVASNDTNSNDASEKDHTTDGDSKDARDNSKKCHEEKPKIEGETKDFNGDKRTSFDTGKHQENDAVGNNEAGVETLGENNVDRDNDDNDTSSDSEERRRKRRKRKKKKKKKRVANAPGETRLMSDRTFR
ncbi:expressed unknown protein [Seminavis robusta]|uniref:Uncharacterized protein n=1 Tax=Seminavis robusta TaxID=568900 RepID=A0A9N8EDY4_9STRA|nr:expressed unknown protein [Seminavis robusta]|eukprot:Sro1012_g231140.1 n/a (284) ;mRNA; r:7202-8053